MPSYFRAATWLVFCRARLSGPAAWRGGAALEARQRRRRPLARRLCARRVDSRHGRRHLPPAPVLFLKSGVGFSRAVGRFAAFCTKGKLERNGGRVRTHLRGCPLHPERLRRRLGLGLRLRPRLGPRHRRRQPRRCHRKPRVSPADACDNRSSFAFRCSQGANEHRRSLAGFGLADLLAGRCPSSEASA